MKSPALLLGLALVTLGPAAGAPPVDVRAYPSLQAAIDANPGRIIQIPAGEYTISSVLMVSGDHTELHGPARIVQTNAAEPIIRIANRKGVRLVGLSFTRQEGRQETNQPGIEISQCEDLELSAVQVSENHTRASISIRSGRDVTVQECTVINYKGVTIDDRTANSVHGYAFKAIDGTGIQMDGVQGGVIRNCRVIERRLWPTQAVRDQYGLGQLTIIPKERTRMMSQEIFDTHYTNNWHQGAAIKVGKPDPANRIIIAGNTIEHPAQGVDIHCDNVVVSNNMISFAMTGIKTTHGARNILIEGNQVTHVDLRGIEMHSGSSSHESANAVNGGKALAENLDGGSIVANNIFSNFGFGDQYWNWAGSRPRNAIAITSGPLEENPPIRNVLVLGNVVFDSGRDTVLQDGRWVKVGPRYHHALYVEKNRGKVPVNVQVFGNLLEPGLEESAAPSR